MSNDSAALFGDPRLPRRFWEKVRVSQDGCWLWTAYCNREGYGRTRHAGRQQMAHRVAYETFVGPIADGLVIDHLCRTRACCNPAHLEPVTQQANVLRGVGHAARNAAVTECSHGHPYDAENTYVYQRKDGRVGRYCLACRRERRRIAA